MRIKVGGFGAVLACALGVLLATVSCRGGKAQAVAPSATATATLVAPSAAATIMPEKAPAEPPKLLSFTLEDPEGRAVKLSTWRGHPMLVDFWATWCPPCREEVPELKAIYRKYHSRGLEVVGISVDAIQGDGAKAVRHFARKFKIEYPLLMADEAVVDAFDISNLPTTLLINRSGTTISRVEGAGRPGDLTAQVRDLLHH